MPDPERPQTEKQISHTKTIAHIEIRTTGVGRGGGVCRGSDTPNYLCGGYRYVYPPRKNQIIILYYAKRQHNKACKVYATRIEMLGKAI